MASYTDNYALTKPTMAESADIRVINSNMDTVDDVMHSTQISLAPAYDLNETYNTGDVVMYELLMYECLEDDVTGAWDATKWQRTTAGEHGGGSDVEVTQIQTEGKAVASIAVDGVSTNILIPELKVYGEATGDLITIEDAMEAPLEECKVTLEPQQDLNGYDSPWPAGGGKNKFQNTLTSGTSGGITYTANADGSVKTSGTSSSLMNIVLGTVTLPSETYILSGCPSGGGVNTYRLQAYDSNITPLDTGDGVEFTLESESTLTVRIQIRAADLAINSTWYPMIRLATETDATFAPYSNICPISGWDEVNVQRTGKNLFDPTVNPNKWINASGGIVNDNTSITSQRISAKEGVTYTFTTASNAGIYCIAFYDIKMNLLERKTINDGVRLTATAPEGSVYLYAGAYKLNEKPQLEIGSTATAYEPYNGQTYTIQLGDTYYGGELDVKSGVLRVDRESVDMGTLNYTYISGYQYFQTTITDKAFGIENIISSHYSIDTSSVATMRDWTMKGNTSNSVMYFKNQAYNDASEFKTAMSGIQLVYELATPQEIQLTPTEVTLLLGINNIWSDGEMYIKYRRDIEMLLQRIADSLGGNA